MILIPQTQKDSLLPPSPARKLLQSDVLLQSVMAVVVFLRRQVQNQIGTQQQSRIGLGTQNLARHNVHQIGETRSRLRELPHSPDSDQIGDTPS